MKQIFLILAVMFLLIGCVPDKKEKAEKENIPKRMIIVEEHSTTWGVKDWYILKDSKTGYEYLVCLTGNSDGGVAVIKLEGYKF